MAADLYEILGVSKNATDDEIKKAFRSKARKLHPDVNKAPDAEEQFKALNEAYDVLSDQAKRAQYDRFGTIPGAASVPGGAGGGYQYVDLSDIFGEGFGGMGDIFSSFFGGSNGRRTTRREGRDMGVGLRITLEEVATGCKKEIVYDRLAPCDVCNGSGMADGGQEITCTTCRGQGQVVTVQTTFLGNMQTATTCPDCGGAGKRIDKPCEECEGQGRIPDRQRVNVEVPAGIREGQQLRVAAFGEAGIRGAQAGDLIVTCRIVQHEIFHREGNDLHARAHISFIQATLGATIEVDGVLTDERIDVRIPEGCQNDQVIKVKGRGMPRLGSSSRGDLFIHITVTIPKKVTKKQRELLEAAAQEFGDEITTARTPLEKLRDAFL